jgi:hypothetical protein
MQPAPHLAYPDLIRVDLGVARNQLGESFCRGNVKKPEIMPSQVIVPVSLCRRIAVIFQRIGGLSWRPSKATHRSDLCAALITVVALLAVFTF